MNVKYLLLIVAISLMFFSCNKVRSTNTVIRQEKNEIILEHQPLEVSTALEGVKDSLDESSDSHIEKGIPAAQQPLEFSNVSEEARKNWDIVNEEKRKEYDMQLSDEMSKLKEEENKRIQEEEKEEIKKKEKNLLLMLLEYGERKKGYTQEQRDERDRQREETLNQYEAYRRFKYDSQHTLIFEAYDNERYIAMTENRLFVLNDYMVRSKGIDGLRVEEYDITIEKINNLIYMSFYYDGDFLVAFTYSKKPLRLMVLYLNNNIVSFYNESHIDFYYLKSFDFDYLKAGCKITATCELKEIDYRDGIYIERIIAGGRPLALSSSGIGEKLLFTYTSHDNFQGFSSMVVSNGYVNYENPQLYEQNNRLKKIRLRDPVSGEYADFELEDTPQYQKIDFGDKFSARIDLLEMEILEVYEGTLYNELYISDIILYTKYEF